MYHHQVRASSSCSAPPDLLLVNDRENNIPLRSAVTDVIGGTTTPPTTGVNGCPDLATCNNNQKLQHQQHAHHQQQQQKQQHQTQHPQQTHVKSYNSSKDVAYGRHQKVVGGSKQVQHNLQQKSPENEGHVESQQCFSSARHANHQQQRTEEHIRLEVSQTPTVTSYFRYQRHGSYHKNTSNQTPCIIII